MTPRVPEIVAVPGKEADTVNVTLVCPAGTTTELGTRATNLLLLESDTDMPPDGAGPLSKAVPVDEAPHRTEVGFNVRDASWGGRTCSV